MENKTDDRFGMPAEFTLTPETSRIRVKFFEKNVSNELSSDYTLPDYLPEIRKILGIYPKISPISRYIGNSVEFSGRVDYDLLYCDAEAKLTSVPLGEDFTFEVEPEVPNGIEWSNSGEAYADISADTTYVRATAPRKVNVKCRLHALIRAYGYDDTTADVGRTAGAEMLKVGTECAELYRSMSEVVELSDELDVGSTAELRYIGSNGNVNITEVTHNETRLNCRGEVITETLTENKETGEINSITKKLPFSQDIELPSDVSGKQIYPCVRGKCSEIKISDGEDKYLIDTEVILEADTVASLPIELTTDIFVPGTDSTTSYRDCKYESLLKSGNAGVSLSQSMPLSELSLSEGSEILCKNAVIRTDGVGTSQNGNGTAINGSVKLKIISKCGEEFSSGETSIPFSAEIGKDFGGKKLSLSAYPTLSDLRIRTDGEKATVEGNISLAYILTSEENIRIADGVTVAEESGDKRTEKSSGITIYYPENGETLWNIAKKFGTSPRSVAQINDLPSANGNNTVSGKRFLMIY